MMTQLNGNVNIRLAWVRALLIGWLFCAQLPFLILQANDAVGQDSANSQTVDDHANDEAALIESKSNPPIALKVAKILTCSDNTNLPAFIADGVILMRDGKIVAIGSASEIEIPDDFQIIEHPNGFAMPGLVEAHSHVGGTSDLNEMVYPTNPELRNWDQIIPHNDQLKVAIAGGITTICFIPGSGTNMGGFGTLMKTGPGTLNEVIIKAPGVLKIAQAGNPERSTGEVGSGRMGMNYVIRQELRDGQLYHRQWEAFEQGKAPQPKFNLRLENFRPLFRREIPVAVHTQQYQVVMATIRMLHDEFNLKILIDHGTFDAFHLGEELAKRDIPVIAGPRAFLLDRDLGQVRGIVDEYEKRGVEVLGVNTDAPVIPQEELSFQATMAVRYGWSDERAIRGVTIEVAKALMIDDRVGSLDVGKDADVVVATGSLIDPRNYVNQVFINGKSVYDTKVDRRRF